MGEGQGGCDRRIEVFGKIHKKKIGVGGLGRGVGVGLVGGGGQGGCERRIEVFVKTKKKWGGSGGLGRGESGGGGLGRGGGRGVRVDVNVELKFL